MEKIEAEKKRETKAKEHNLIIIEISDSLKRNNIRIIGVSGDEEREKGVEGLSEQITEEKCPNLEKDTHIKIQEAHRTPIRFNKNPASPRHIIAKFTKYTDKKEL